MNATFIEWSLFHETREEHLPDAAYARLQRLLLQDPDAGAVMPGCGGLRKIRTADPGRGKGKRGGARIMYLHVPEAKRFFMVHIYSKDEKADLSAKEKRVLKALAEEYKRESIAQYQRWLKENRP